MLKVKNMIVKSAFKPAWWLRNPHAQTIFSYLFRNSDLPYTRNEYLELPDGDLLDLVWLDGGLSVDAPLIILLHGLTGSSKSPYIKTQMRRYQQLGWRSVVMQCRSASAESNRRSLSYHAGYTKDLNYFLHTLALREPHTKKGLIGFSLGANVILKWLGENSHQDLIDSAVVVSTPFQLSVVADRLNQGFSRIYQDFLLRSLRCYFMSYLKKSSDQALIQSIKSARCFWTFDEHVTAPLCGFDGVHSYYREASSRPYLHKITTPTLVLHALDDPFMSPEAIPTLAELSPSITLELSDHGGHLGFVEGVIPGVPKFWLDERVAAFFANYVN